MIACGECRDHVVPLKIRPCACDTRGALRRGRRPLASLRAQRSNLALNASRPRLLQPCGPRNDGRREELMQQTSRVRQRQKRKSSGWIHDDKRRTAAEWRARQDSAGVEAARRFCNALCFWRDCLSRTCRRRQACVGNAWPCLQRYIAGVNEKTFAAARAEAAVGGKSRFRPRNGPERHLYDGDFAKHLWREAQRDRGGGPDPACVWPKGDNKVT
jgi:hypothetical protein